MRGGCVGERERGEGVESVDGTAVTGEGGEV